MFERIPFKREHLTHMLLQQSNKENKDYFATVDFNVIEQLISFTGMLKGRPAICGGVIPYWYGRGYLWTVFDEDIKKCFVPVFRGIKAFLEDVRPMYNRLEIAVPCDFEKGLRRARLLGFTTECERAVKFLPNGQDCSLLVLLGGK